ncbi:MAG TPA: recombinase family protein [Armatimonadota bacterium]|jgi:DNA invertase Pin-like site-specific DNA recombinase
MNHPAIPQGTVSDEELRRGYAAIYFEEVARRTRIGMAERAEAGLPNYRPPLGYRLAWEGGEPRVEVVEEAAAWVREAFRLAARGMTIRAILKELTTRGMRSARGKEMSPTALWKILRNPFYVGTIQHQGKLLPGGHEAIVGRELFDLVRRRSAR